jgi:plasmid stabilization system protein ParE
MAKRKIKIIWSNRAKKRLYGILEFHVGRNKGKNWINNLLRVLFKEVKILAKYPGTGLKTTENTIRGLIIDDNFLFYEINDDKIIIHTIWDSGQAPDIKIIK